MITRKLNDENLDDLIEDIVCKWEYLDDDLMVLYDLDCETIRITTKPNRFNKKQDESEYLVMEQDIMERIKSKDGPNWNLTNKEKEEGPFKDENIQALKNWLQKNYNIIHIDNENLKICRNCYKTIQDGEWSPFFETPNDDGLIHICSDCSLEFQEYIEDLEGCLHPWEELVKKEDDRIIVTICNDIGKWFIFDCDNNSDLDSLMDEWEEKMGCDWDDISTSIREEYKEHIIELMDK